MALFVNARRVALRSDGRMGVTQTPCQISYDATSRNPLASSRSARALSLAASCSSFS